ncbi:MAG: alpha/beta fold hydrolase [Pontixanthobacter sp.]
MLLLYRTGLAIAGIYCLILLALFLAQRSLIYPAPTHPIAEPPGFEQVVFETSDRLRLKAAWRKPRSAQPVVVFFHGNGDNWSGGALATQALTEAGFGILLSEYRGYSGNPGSPDEQGLYRDGRAALDWLKQQGVADQDIILIGNSLGSGVATRLASEKQYKAVILVSPYASMVQLIGEKFPWVPVGLLLRDRYDNSSILSKVKSPVLLLHGSTDTLIPLSHAQHLERVNNQARLVTFDGVGHELAYLAEAQAEQLRWLDAISRQ